MADINELKEIIIDLKMELIEERIPRGYCPYSVYTPTTERKEKECLDCDKCRRTFMRSMEKDIRAEVEKL